MTFFCPKCGNALVQSTAEPGKSDKSLRFDCKNKACIYKDTEFIVHHPIYGLNAAPGDSWAITWLK